ncbi:Mce-associated membrane protein [Rhodococcus erythropolis]|uniref:hypothetical protein n=1 Tax=Rhodococcus erythropolis TaxID=1833 RepID=UPI00216A07ED|nr:hypothetical protein [Rhodococcus erythropolis]MCS4256013.1 Mce-associated membrane protein [Rhodococcus erythropolis]MCW2425530.1 Mce-associated membrane protein [Rhodococcus erythropolis]
MSGLLGVAVLSAVGFGAWKLHDTSTELDALHTQRALQADAEQAALNYATGAAQMDFRDLESWRSRLTANTTSALADRLNQASTSMEQIIVPLQWSSTAQPIAAKAEASGDGTYSVDCFVSVRTTNAQSPEGIQSTATYKLTMDSSDGWRITEITGVGTTLGDGETIPAK